MKIKLSTFLASTSLMLFQPLIALAQQTPPSAPPTPPPYPYYGYGPGPWHHMWGGGWGYHWGFFVLVIVAAIVFFAIARRSHGAHHHWGPGRMWGDTTTSALQILNERYAKGEIQKAEYEEKKAAILSGARPS